MKNIIGIRTLKTAIGAAIAMILADLIGLEFVVSAGIITILSIQNTKKQSVEIALKRFVAAVAALGIAGILFSIIGYNPIAFGFYLLIFIPFTVKFKLTEGIVMSSVLVTHFLSKQTINWGIFLNEIGLVLIGAGIALIFNLYMPSIEKELNQYRHEIEEDMFNLFRHMSEKLRQYDTCIDCKVFDEIGKKIKKAKILAYKHSNNYLIASVSDYENYFSMRGRQFQVMRYMEEHFSRFFMTVDETNVVVKLANRVALSIKGEIMAKDLLEEIKRLRETFRHSSLPKTREEFENRAMLYQYLNDLEHFLQIKEDFRSSLSKEGLEEYMKGYTNL